MRLWACVLLLSWARSAGAAPLRADPSLVEPYSYELEEKGNLKKPFLVHFKDGDSNLYFLGSRHENSRESKTFRLVRQAFRQHAIRLVVIEGYRNAEGDDPKGFVSYAEKSCAESFCPGGEPAYSALTALRKGASFVGGEPSDAQVFAALRKMGYKTPDMLGFYFVRQLPQYKRERRLERAKLGALFEEFKGYYEGDLGSADVAAFTFERFKTWYRRRNGKAFSIAGLDSEETAPLAGGKYFTQRISSAVDLMRNRFVLDLIARRLGSDRDVLAVFGGSHYFSLRPALEAMLGKPAVEFPAP